MAGVGPGCGGRRMWKRHHFSLLWPFTDIKEHVKQLEKAVSGKEPRFVLRALRMLPSTSRRLNHYVLYKAVHGFFTSNNTTRDFLLSFLEEVSVRCIPKTCLVTYCGRAFNQSSLF